MSTTPSAGQTPPSRLADAPAHGQAKRTDGGQGAPADLFSSLLGLMTDNPAIATERGEPIAAHDDLGPDGNAVLAAVIDWLQVPSNALNTAGSDATPAAEAAVGQFDTAQSPASGLMDTGEQGVQAQGPDPVMATSIPATEIPLDGQHATTPVDQDMAPPAASPPQTPAGRPAASLGRAAQASTTQMLQNTDSVQWRSTTAARQDATSPSAPALASAANWSGMRSTVTLHHRFGATLGVENLSARSADSALPGSPNALLGVAGSQAGEASLGQRQGGFSGDGTSSTDLADASADEMTDAENTFAMPEAEADEAHNQDLRGWTTGALRQASLRVGQHSGDAIDIELSLRGQEVSVDFRTDNAEARSSLQASAGAALTDLLQRSGMQLGGLTVGGQALPERQNPEQAAMQETARRSGRNQVTTGDDLVPSGPVRPQRSDGSSSLDLFV